MEGKLQPVGVGTATITVSSPATTNYNAATPKTFTVTVTQKTPYTDSFAGLTWLNGKDINGDGAEDNASDFLAGNKVSPSGTVQAIPILDPGSSLKQPVWIAATRALFDGNDFRTQALPNSLTGNSGFTLLVVAESNASASQSLLNLGAPFGNVDRLGLTTAGFFLYQNGSTSVAQWPII